MNKPALSRMRARPSKPPQPPNTQPPPWRPSPRAREPAVRGANALRNDHAAVRMWSNRSTTEAKRLKANTQRGWKNVRLSREEESPEFLVPGTVKKSDSRLCQHTTLIISERLLWPSAGPVVTAKHSTMPRGTRHTLPTSSHIPSHWIAGHQASGYLVIV